MSHPVEEWWTQRQLALVEDRNRTWCLKSFDPGPAVEHCSNATRIVGKAAAGVAGSNLIADGWDHEHCELCWAKISRLPGDSSEGYSDGDQWICIECFTRFVLPRQKA